MNKVQVKKGKTGESLSKKSIQLCAYNDISSNFNGRFLLMNYMCLNLKIYLLNKCEKFVYKLI